SARLGVGAERGPVVDAVPGHVDRDARAAARQLVDERGVRDPLPDGAGGARPRVDVEAGAGVPVAPGRRLELEPAQLGEDGVVAHARAVLRMRGAVVEFAFDWFENERETKVLTSRARVSYRGRARSNPHDEVPGCRRKCRIC